jgi:ABC-type oligopeptide transport system ATPase subunit
MTGRGSPDGPSLVSVQSLRHGFVPPGGWWGRRSEPIQVLEDVSFDVEKGECLGVVGDSGAGKTTLARCLLRLVQPQDGRVLFEGKDVLTMSPVDLAAFRGRAQIVFQDPFGSLNPRLRAGPMLEEVLLVAGKADRRTALRESSERLLDLVGLRTSHWGRFPHELSGGQRQRLGIARALSVEPDFLVLDEPVSALDLSVQAQILNLLTKLQERLSLTLVLIAHDLTVVRQVADRVAVLHEGRIVELSPVQELFRNPCHSYTRTLLETVVSK